MADNTFLTPVSFRLKGGRIAPGLSGWRKEKAEVLELLAFWKPEQQAAHRFRIWRPAKEPPLQHFISKSSIKETKNQNCISYLLPL